jgi:hypothetical protein
MKFAILTISLLSTGCLSAQELKTKKPSFIRNAKSFYDLSFGTNANEQTATVAYGSNWSFGKRKQWQLGFGARYSGYFGKQKNYQSAPPEFYRDNDKMDTILVAKPQQNNTALFLNATYRIKQKFELGFNIDAIGVSFGAPQNGQYITNGLATPASVTTNGISALLVEANDIGMIKAEYYIAYWVKPKWMVRFGAVDLYSEYKTATELQTGNTRYRGASYMPFLAFRWAPKN